eukprot:2766940-Rhodomonas_salina.2
MGIGVMCDMLMSQQFHVNLYNTVTYLQEYDNLKDVNEKLSQADTDFWWDEKMDEYNLFIEMGVFEECDLPAGRQEIKSLIIFKLKRKAQNMQVRYKALWIAHGFQAEYGVDFFESFSAMSNPSTQARAIFALAAS